MKRYQTLLCVAEKFLENFTRSDIEDQKTYIRFKTYRSLHNKGKLTKGSYEAVLMFLGYIPLELWKEPEKPSDKLIDILID